MRQPRVSPPHASRWALLQSLLAVFLCLVCTGCTGSRTPSWLPQGPTLWVRQGSAREFDRCTANLRTLDQALQTYANRHQGAFPLHLSELGPEYCTPIPACPLAHAGETYEQGYTRGQAPDRYALCCMSGGHRLQTGADFLPAMDSLWGLRTGHYQGTHQACEERMRTIAKGIEAYRDSHGGALPTRLEDVPSISLPPPGPHDFDGEHPSDANEVPLYTKTGVTFVLMCPGANHLNAGIAPFYPQVTSSQGARYERMPGEDSPGASKLLWALIATSALLGLLLWLERKAASSRTPRVSN